MYYYIYLMGKYLLFTYTCLFFLSQFFLSVYHLIYTGRFTNLKYKEKHTLTLISCLCKKLKSGQRSDFASFNVPEDSSS